MKQNPSRGQVWFVENFEAILLAVLVALIVRHFCLEAFKIPTTSMEPTLIGDPRCGDRILVNKMSYRLRSPKRWEVIVFKYPLDYSRNFIKRLVGLPGEELAIKNGDIYINGKITRKPKAIQEELLYPIFQEHDDLREQWYPQQPKAGITLAPQQINWASSAWSWLTYSRRIDDEYTPKRDDLFLNRSQPSPPVGGSNQVGDLVLGFSYQSHSFPSQLALQLREGHLRFRVTLSFQKEQSTGVLQGYKGKKLRWQQAFSLPPSRGSCQLSNLDGLVTFKVNDQTKASIDYSQPLTQAPNRTYEVEVKVGGKGRISIQRASLYRDIYYQGKKNFFSRSSSWKIPQGYYFVLGDNPPNSQDSRTWQEFYFFLPSGLAIAGDQQQYPYGLVCEFTDTSGKYWEIHRNDLQDTYFTHQATPFIPENYLVGEGLAVFWPPTRIKLIK